LELRILEITSNYRGLLEITGDYWRLLEITRDSWKLLEITGDYWWLLKTIGVHCCRRLIRCSCDILGSITHGGGDVIPEFISMQ